MAEIKYWREENRTYLKDVVPLDTPYNIGIEVSSLCNARCVYCAHSKPNHGLYEGNMSIELFRKIIEQIHEFPKKIRLIETYSFGEPLCNPHLEEMIEIIRKENIAEKINFTTNGLLFNKKRTDALMEAGVDTIRISLQGLNAETYKKMCGVNVNFDEYNAVDFSKIYETINENAMNGRENVSQKKINIVCHRPVYRLRIAANGDVTVACCDSARDIYYGNIKKNEEISKTKKKHKELLFII